ncbi:hypothetical protein BWI15_00310 [Kribbella sp. ALI-6-A]|uniref:hypothetical protein n=1 Tax=Kribbella sp. ALI-6-A TaxID=1933817 RepID=UPI00097C0377|nr:hypothetical protein [Kribbella sp. ALI-6-A]ONI79055.1 hypothetical protein BWI15_00310 [Kribbella sp. ALI-6-A]
MSEERYSRFAVPRPEHLGEAHWGAINIEVDRFVRALEDGDDAQALGQLKCVVEAVAKVVHDINGQPVGSNSNFDTIVNGAHDLLARQPGRELAYQSPFGDVATQARKIAVNLSRIRNSYGGGHGRARQPELQAEMLDLAMDGALMWTRWALRRIGHYLYGRPETLIRDLIGDPYGQIVFYGGTLTERLADANLGGIEERHARAIGLAVGQRAARDTFIVRHEGVQAAIDDDSLERWPVPYRLGVAYGLLFTPEELPTLTTYNLLQAMQICEPVREAPNEVSAILNRVRASRPPGPLLESSPAVTQLLWLIQNAPRRRPEEEHEAWRGLWVHLVG